MYQNSSWSETNVAVERYIRPKRGRRLAYSVTFLYGTLDTLDTLL